MSTASEENSPDQPQRTSHQPGPLAILAATAIGGVIATRIGRTPFLLAAGAAALALLNQKKGRAPEPAPAPPSAPPPEAPVEDPAQSQVEAWLSRQMTREEEAPFVDLSTADLSPSPIEDDYSPPTSFLLDEEEAVAQAPPTNEVFAILTEPVVPQPVLEPEPAPEVEMEIAIEEEPEEPSPAPQVFQAFAPPPPQVFHAFTPPPPPQPVVIPAIPDAAWTLGVDPLPSLNEAAPYVAPVGSLFFSSPIGQEAPAITPAPFGSKMFSSAPLQEEESGPPLFFSTAMFQGAAFPDEIQVSPAFAPAFAPFPHLEPAATSVAAAPPLEPAPEPSAPPAKDETIPEIEVQIAAPGEASFDEPLEELSENPWLPQPDDLPPSPPQASTVIPPNHAVLEAEIILRPRAPVQNTVIAKFKPAPSAEDALPTPPEAPGEVKARPSWRSWWRGD